MKIDRDHFRFLTGFGRDVAAYVDYVFEIIQHEPLVPGNLIIRHDCDKREFTFRFEPFKDEPELVPVTHDTHHQLMLSIWIESGGFREATSLSWYMLNPHSSSSGYHVYQHRFIADYESNPITSCVYTGVTRRGWRTRWQEHLRAANSGSHYRFHKAIREWHGKARIVLHDIVGSASSETKAMEIEEFLVERDSLYPLGLNMIPGGKSGLAYLRKIGAIGPNERVGVDDRQEIINRFFDRTSRKGLPNPLAAANWLNSDYAEKVICAGPDRLKPQQIRDARFFASLGQNADDIASRIGARNAAQVERLVSGQTYSRIA